MVTSEPVMAKFTKGFIVTTVVAFAVIMVFCIYTIERAVNPYAHLVSQNISDTGVSNPVTAVLLNFRAYDTLLEFAVLLCIGIAVTPYFNQTRLHAFNWQEDHAVVTLANTLTPIIVLAAGYFLWVGAFAPGGAFQAGALLSSAALLLTFAGQLYISASNLRWKVICGVGLISFLSVIAIMYLDTAIFLQFPPNQAGMYILAIEAMATLSIAAILYMCFAAILTQQGAQK